MSDFLHGVEVITVDNGPYPIKTVKTSVIGIIGSAPNASEEFPLNKPILVSQQNQIKDLGDTGTLPDALNAIYQQCAALCVVVRVKGEELIDESIKQNNEVKSNEEDAQESVFQALIEAESTLGVRPKILIAPGISRHKGVIEELNNVANKLKAIAVIDGPNEDNQNAIKLANGLGSKRLYLIDPAVKVWDNQQQDFAIKPASPYVAGLIAQADNARGFWWSPSNQLISGIVGTARPIDFVMGDKTSSANLLNEQKIATIINQNGYRLWGNRTLSADATWSFLQVVRVADIINESILRAHLWAIDRNIGKTYYDDVMESINSYLRHLQQLGAILGGQCSVDKEKNPISEISQGHVTFEFDFTPPVAAEHITIESKLVNHYFANALQ